MNKTYYFSLVRYEFDETSQYYVLKRAFTIFNNLTLNGIKTQAKCGGKALCGGCRIKVLSNQKYCNQINAKEMAIFNEKDLNDGWRLSCQLYCLQESYFFLPKKKDSSRTS